MAWKIFLHSVRLVLRNWQQALKLSSPAIVLTLLSLALPGPDIVTDPDLMSEVFFPSPGRIVLSFVILFAALVVAVAWHRFVLLEEMTTKPYPQFHEKQVLAYFGKFFLLILSYIVIMLGFTFVLMLLSFVGSLLSLLFLPLVVILAWAFFRLSPTLPAAAVGQSMKFRDAWSATESLSGTLFGLIFIVSLVSLPVGLLLTLLAFNSILMMAATLVVNWFFMMVNVSILTTIYGISVEGRQI